MKVLSLCSGIEAASVAFESLNWEMIGFSEIEPFPCAVLAHHYPDVPNFGDMTKFREWSEEVFMEADMIVGGPPCQAFSVAGNREGLNDERGNLTLVYVELINYADSIRKKYGRKPVIALYENVPGLLSDKTNAFGCFLAGLAGEDEQIEPPGKKWTNAGYVLGSERAIAWRILDAQHFRLAQRRRRVFVIANARDGFDPTEVLFEFDGVRRDTPPSREERKEVTTDAQASVGTYNKQRIGIYSDEDIASTCAARDYKGATDLVAYAPSSFAWQSALDCTVSNNICNTLTKCQTQAVTYALQGNMIGRNDNAGPQGSGISEDISFTLTKADQHAVAYDVTFCDANGTRKDRSNGGLYVNETDSSKTITAGGDISTYIINPPAMAVRRLTPTECERLQGFPDGYTAIPWRDKPADECPDSLRYKALGNSWAVPVVRWIGNRINSKLEGELRQLDNFVRFLRKLGDNEE